MSAQTTDPVFTAVGRRKNATARVRLVRGTGKITVNDRDPESYFRTEEFLRTALCPLSTAERREDVDLLIRARGGGIHGQAGAVRLGIARALEKMDDSLRAPLKKDGHLKRDPRKRERKKTGQPGARKKFQFSKR